MLKRLIIFTGIWLVATVPAAATPMGDLFQAVHPAVGVIKTVQKDYAAAKNGKDRLGLGSGVLISADGKMLTAAHVVHTADAVAVEFAGGETIPAKILGSLPSADIALLQIERMPDGIQPARLGDSDRVKPGDEVMVIGSPYGLNHTLTAGHISGRHAIDNPINELVEVEILQSDAAVNRGNSGGPMFNLDGEVIGIVSQILTKSGGFEGISFAVAINVAKKMLLEQPTRWAGVDGLLIRGPLAKAFNIPQSAGYLVQRVAEGSQGEALGLRHGSMEIEIEDKPMLVGGDIILGVDDLEIADDPRSMVEMIRLIRGKAPGERLKIKILREGRIEILEKVVE